MKWGDSLNVYRNDDDKNNNNNDNDYNDDGKSQRSRPLLRRIRDILHARIRRTR
jgi:hypothetical protein